MKFSVIIPLQFHRGQGAKCVTAWCREQSFPRQEYEVICVMPQSYPARGRRAIEALLQTQDQLIMSVGSHDMTHCVEGAAAARGENLFFTESHVWPERAVLTATAIMLQRNPGWAGFSCKTLRVTSNRLAEAEADMYEPAIDYGMNVHPWRKILKQCFVTRRKAYFAAGGFDQRLGHFAEWALAASYYSLGLEIGYAPDIVLHHYYVGRLSETNRFAADFLDGEILYLLENPETKLIEPPDEWLVRGNWDRGHARVLLRALWRYAMRRGWRPPGPSPILTLKEMAAWLPASLAGAGLARLGYAARRAWRRLGLEASRGFGSQKALTCRYMHYQAALVHQRRLRLIALSGGGRSIPNSDGSLCFGDPGSATAIAGFHVIETFGAAKFRWSRASAVVEIRLPAGQSRLRLDCLPIELRLQESNVRFLINEQLIPQSQVIIGTDQIIVSAETRRAGWFRLAWICLPLIEQEGSKRPLGLPVVSLTVNETRTGPQGTFPPLQYQMPDTSR